MVGWLVSKGVVCFALVYMPGMPVMVLKVGIARGKKYTVKMPVKATISPLNWD